MEVRSQVLSRRLVASEWFRYQPNIMMMSRTGQGGTYLAGKFLGIWYGSLGLTLLVWDCPFQCCRHLTQSSKLNSVFQTSRLSFPINISTLPSELQGCPAWLGDYSSDRRKATFSLTHECPLGLLGLNNILLLVTDVPFVLTSLAPCQILYFHPLAIKKDSPSPTIMPLMPPPQDP